jgi:general secretion pathway protein C
MCPDVYVFSTVESSDPKWSTAVVRAKDEKRGVVRRVGAPVGVRRLAYIGFNPEHVSPAVWLSGGDGLCQALLFAEKPRTKKLLAGSPPRLVAKRRPPAAKAARSRRRRPPPLPPELARQVRRVNPNEYRIGREVVDTLVTQGAELMRGMRTIPVKEDGRIVGVRIGNVGKGSLLAKLGIRNGDQIKSINGFSVTTPEQALKAYAGLRTASDLTVTVKRKGKPVTLDYHIR